jgi:hypothetical protein
MSVNLARLRYANLVITRTGAKPHIEDVRNWTICGREVWDNFVGAVTDPESDPAGGVCRKCFAGWVVLVPVEGGKT